MYSIETNKLYVLKHPSGVAFAVSSHRFLELWLCWKSVVNKRAKKKPKTHTDRNQTPDRIRSLKWLYQHQPPPHRKSKYTRSRWFMYRYLLAILKKGKPEGCQTAVPAYQMSSDAFPRCLCALQWTSVSPASGGGMEGGAESSQCSADCLPSQRNDENAFITRLWWRSPQAARSNCVFFFSLSFFFIISLEPDVLHVFYIFVHFNQKCSRFLNQQEGSLSLW